LVNIWSKHGKNFNYFLALHEFYSKITSSSPKKRDNKVNKLLYLFNIFQ